MKLETIDGKNFWLKIAITCPFKPFGKVRHKCIRCRETIPQQYLFCLKLNKGIVLKEDLREKLKDRLKENNKKYYEWAEKVKKNPDDHYKQGKCWEYEGCCEEDRELLAELGKGEK